jgi:hypothetical protein
MDPQVDGDRAAAGECLQRGAQAAVGQDRRVDAACGLSQFLERIGGLGDSLVDLPAEFGGAAACAAQLQCEGDQSLLGAVVQVPLDPAACLVGSGDDPCPGAVEAAAM